MGRQVSSEIKQVEIVKKELIDCGHRVFLEVPLFSSSVDMVVLNSENKLTAIELKLKDWKRALNQVKLHTICMDYLYICILELKTIDGKKRVENSCLKTGIGLYYLDVNGEAPNLKEVVKPKMNNFVWSKMKNELYNYLINRQTEV